RTGSQSPARRRSEPTAVVHRDDAADLWTTPRSASRLRSVIERSLRPAHAPVPFLDLTPVHDDLKESILADIAAIVDANAFTNGPLVAAFQRQFAAYCGTPHCVAVPTGLDALRLALLAGAPEPA